MRFIYVIILLVEKSIWKQYHICRFLVGDVKTFYAKGVNSWDKRGFDTDKAPLYRPTFAFVSSICSPRIRRLTCASSTSDSFRREDTRHWARRRLEYPMDWQGGFRGKRPTIKNTFCAIAHNFPSTCSTQKLLVSKLFLVSTSKSLKYASYCVLKTSKVLMFCQDF